jgi:hypothetical protein
MPKPRSTIPIVHADKLTFALSDEEWQAIPHAYGRQLNADARQEITTVTTQYFNGSRIARPRNGLMRG